ncbi:hypothetical protein CISIN_1g0022621mg, partial [Citrus sinensis]
MADKF